MSPKSHNLFSPVFHRALFFTLLAWMCPLAWGQAGYRPTPNYIATGKPDQAEGAKILAEFQKAGISGTYWLDFELRVMPRQGAETKIAGQMFGTRTDRGPLTRVTIDPQSWLIQSGLQPSAWMTQYGSAPSLLSAAQTLDPLAGTDLTIFELQMPFLYWTDFVYEGLTRTSGRPAHSFVLYPPANLAAARHDLTGVRILLDTQFQALMQAELLGAKGAVEKTITILDIKRVGERWIFKSIDFRNHLTRGKTRFNVLAVALDLSLPDAVFDPAQLGAPPPQIPPEKILRF